MSSFIDRYSIKQFGLKKNETTPHILKKLSHLYLNGKRIEEIGNLSQCENLRVLYLHNNNIKEIRNCQELGNLTHLYLQWNKIRKIENINGLRNLRKLYLGNNEICRLENIDNLRNLEELHIERQKSGTKYPLEFSFDECSIIGVAATLKVLNVSDLRLSSLHDLLPLQNLQELNATNNQFVNAVSLAKFVNAMPALIKVTLKRCPAQRHDLYYRDKIIAGTDNLSILDDKYISQNVRIFLKCLEQMKMEKTARTQVPEETTEKELIDELTEMFEKKYLNHMDSSYSVMSASGDDELCFKAWQSLKLRDSGSSKKLSKSVKQILQKAPPQK